MEEKTLFWEALLVIPRVPARNYLFKVSNCSILNEWYKPSYILIFFSQYFLLNMFHLNDSVDILGDSWNYKYAARSSSIFPSSAKHIATQISATEAQK